MPFNYFDEWFAILDLDDDKNIRPGRLIYDPNSGIRLLAVEQFRTPASDFSKSLEKDLIIGLLDYQRPTTLINNFLSVRSTGTMSANTRYMRNKYVVSSNFILKNIHLRDINGKYFLDFRSNLPAFHAWIGRKSIDNIYEEVFEEDFSEVKLSKSVRIERPLSGGSHFIIESFLMKGMADREENFEFKPASNIQILFSKALDFESVENIARKFENMFSFLIGTRLKAEPYYMTTTETVEWNEEKQQIIAEALFIPAWNRQDSAPYISERMYTIDSTPIKIEIFIEKCLDEKENDIFYWMGLVLAYRMRDIKGADYFFEVVGALENLDRKLFGDKENNRAVILRRRLERLILSWKLDGFRGNPDLSIIVSLRNMRAHGKYGEYTIDQIKTMSILNKFLAALLNYHILKLLGFDKDSIAKGFRRSFHQLGMFIPKEFIT